MDSTDIQVLDTVLEWQALTPERRYALITVAATWGSSPRPPGAWAAIRDDGMVVGSVSGGCIEDDLILRVRDAAFWSKRTAVLQYGGSSEEAQRFDIPCGGKLELVVETAPDAASLRLLRLRIADGLATARTLALASGNVMLENAAMGDPLVWKPTDANARLTTIHGPTLRLLLIGAGQISSYLAPMAQALDYRVTVCDPREEYRLGWKLPGVNLIADMPDDAVTAFVPDARSAIVALTHDPKLDDMALLEALRSAAFYVGALGSRANTAKRKQRLREHFDMSEAELARLHGPVGLPIGSRTPPEIALAILADLTATKNGVYLVAAGDTPHRAVALGHPTTA